MLEHDGSCSVAIQRHEGRTGAFSHVQYHTLLLTSDTGAKGTAGIWIDAEDEETWRRIRALYLQEGLGEFSYWESQYLQRPELSYQRAKVFPFGSTPAHFVEGQRYVPVELLRHGGKTWWLFREVLYWEDEGLTAEGVRTRVLGSE